MARILLSSTLCGGRVDWTFRTVWEAGYNGVEFQPGRKTTASEIMKEREQWPTDNRGGRMLVTLHGPWWPAVGRYSWYDQGTFFQALETWFWNRRLGPLEENPALSIARELRAPIVLHEGVVLTLTKAGQLDLLRGLKIRVENNDNPTVVGGQHGLDSAISACIALANSGLMGRLCLDIEHLSKERWDGQDDFIEKVLRPAFNKRVQIDEVHLCGYDPGGGGIKAGGHLPLNDARNKLPLEQIVRLLTKRCPDADFVVEVGSPRHYLAAMLGLPSAYKAAGRIARESIGFLRPLLS